MSQFKLASRNKFGKYLLNSENLKKRKIFKSKLINVDLKYTNVNN